MFQKVIALLTLVLLSAGTTYAQEFGPGAGRIEIGAYPGGGMFFTQSTDGNAPEFGNYALGGSVTLNVNRWIGIECEGGGTIGIRQNFAVGSRLFENQQTPNMWMYSGNLVVNPIGSDRALVPYATGGLGGVIMCPCAGGETLGVTSYENLLTGNVGGGIKWFMSRHWGVRADYRLYMVRNNETSPEFFGTENRYGHRLQAGVVLTY